MFVYLSSLPYWQIFAISGILLVILEMLTPAMFFLNLAIASFITAVISIYFPDWETLSIIWVILSLVCLLFFHPLMVKKGQASASVTGMGRYVGTRAKVIEAINGDGGVVSVFDERWNAKSIDGSSITKGEYVIIEKNEDLVLFVRKE